MSNTQSDIQQQQQRSQISVGRTSPAFQGRCTQLGSGAGFSAAALTSHQEQQTGAFTDTDPPQPRSRARRAPEGQGYLLSTKGTCRFWCLNRLLRPYLFAALSRISSQLAEQRMLNVKMETNEISVIRIQFSGPRSEQPGILGINPQSAFSLLFPANERDRRFDGDEATKTETKQRENFSATHAGPDTGERRASR